MFHPKLLKFKKHNFKDPHHNKSINQLEKDLGKVENNIKKMMIKEEKAESMVESDSDDESKKPTRKIKSIKPLKFKF
jgi:hypothetical protein